MTSKQVLPLRTMALLLVLAAAICPRLKAAETKDTIDITLRSTSERPIRPNVGPSATEHSKLYVIGGIRAAYLMPTDTSTPLAIPVNEDELRGQFKSILAEYGFHEITWGKTADIVLNLIYGRSQMRNPYASKTIEVDAGTLGLRGVKVVSSSSDELLRERSDPGFYQRLQKADSEKLFMIITAWENPGFNPKARKEPVQLWQTVVYVDNPDANLNVLAGAMLAAAGNYFDRRMTEEETTVVRPVPNGQAVAGTPVEVEPRPDK